MITQRISRLLSRRVIKYSSLSVRHHNFDGEVHRKTHMSMISREDESHSYVIRVSTYGIYLSGGMGVLGPCALFPRAVLQWNVRSAEQITPESLSLFTMLEPKLDILIIGKGDWDAKVDNNIYTYLRSKKINVEILPTEQACSTFNFLNSERRVVAAAIIPPTNVRDMFEDDSIMLQFEDDKVFKEDYYEDMTENIKDESLMSLYEKQVAKKSLTSNHDDEEKTKTENTEPPKK